MLHQHVKQANVLGGADGSAKLMDFGLASLGEGVDGALRAERDAAAKAGAEVAALTEQQLKSRETIEALEAKFTRTTEKLAAERDAATQRADGLAAEHEEARGALEARLAKSGAEIDGLNKQSQK